MRLDLPLNPRLFSVEFFFPSSEVTMPAAKLEPDPIAYPKNPMPPTQQTITLDGNSLTIPDLVRIARDPTIKAAVAEPALVRVRACRKLIDDAVAKYESANTNASRPADHTSPHMVYGVTTGFGEFKNIAIDAADLTRLQENILLSHAVGLGDNANESDPANYFPAEIVRASLVLRVNTFLKGHSGVRPELIDCILKMLNSGIVPLVPTRGSLGSSGDLCPLAHLFVVLLGHGHFYKVATPDDVAQGLLKCQKFPATNLSESLGPIPKLSYKEGLALTNGATFSTAILALSAHDAETLANTADVAAALTLESICGRTRAFDPLVHETRNMIGQRDSAAQILALLESSSFTDRANEVQDAYSVRCVPQVHGSTRDTIAYAKMIAEAEMNAATDNPLFFPGQTPLDVSTRKSRGDSESMLGDQLAYSAGNFHGQPIALAADFLTIAVSELANISERRSQLLLDANHNRGLWPSLSARPGLNTGFMLAQYAAASLVSENKVLSHPASVDSIPTSANSEDHVSMATIAARKGRSVLASAQGVIAIELLLAAQAAEIRITVDAESAAVPARSLEPSAIIANARHRLENYEREFAPGAPGHQRVMTRLGKGTRCAYNLIRSKVRPMGDDRYLEPDVRAVRALVAAGAIPAAVSQSIPAAFRPIAKLTIVQ